MIKIYCDGVFDLFHSGHVNHFKKIKEKFDNVFLIIGVMSDEEATSYKRKPTYNEQQRYNLISSCKYADKVIMPCPLIATGQFITEHKIHYVTHAFANESDMEKQKEYFEIPIRLGKFLPIEYNKGISTTEIMNSWHNIWTKKGNVETDNLELLAGFEDTEEDTANTIEHIINNMNIKPTDKVLEIGCGAGRLSKLLSKKCEYYGIDYSRSLIDKNIMFNKVTVYHCEAKDTPFKSNYFDKIFCYGVFEYFPNKDYLKQVLSEIDRISQSEQSMIYLMQIRRKTRTQQEAKHIYAGTFTHTIFTPDDFPGYTYVPAMYEKDQRFCMKYLKCG